MEYSLKNELALTKGVAFLSNSLWLKINALLNKYRSMEAPKMISNSFPFLFLNFISCENPIPKEAKLMKCNFFFELKILSALTQV